MHFDGNPIQLSRPRSKYIGALGVVVVLAVLTSGCAPINSEVPTETGQAAQSQQEREGPYRVETVIDGDTIKVNRRGQTVTVRVVGIDTPEVAGPYTTQECYGREASARGRKLLAGRDVWLQSAQGQPPQDRYGRELAFVFLDDTTDYGLSMLRDGYAREYRRGASHQHSTQYRAAEQSARAAGRGLWSPTACQ